MRCARISSSSRGCIAGQMLRRTGPAAARAAHRLVDDLAERAHVVDRDDDLDVERLAHAGVDDRDRAAAAVVRCCRRGSGRSRRAGAASPTARCAAGGRLGRSPRAVRAMSARCAPRLVGASAWISSMITASTPRKRLARLRREHQVERLGRGDEDVGRVADERAALSAGVSPVRMPTTGSVQRRRRGARRRGGCRRAAPAGSSRRRPRGPAAARCRGRVRRCLLRHRRGHQAVDGPEERGEGLARAGRGEDQRVVAAPRSAGQPCAWAAVGSANEVSNHARTAGEARQGHPVEATALGPSSTRSRGIRQSARWRDRRRSVYRLSRGGSETSTRWGRL